MKIVSETPEAEVRQRRLEENVRASFAAAAAGVCEFLAGGSPRSELIELMEKFIKIHRATESENIDPNGVPIRIPDLSPKKQIDPDQPINTILRGALRMTAALLLHNAKTDNEDYSKANKELAEGIELLNQAIDQASKSGE